LLQINIALPATLAPGSPLPLVLRFGSAGAPAMNLHVR
jgi:hypothetical protein